MDMSGELRNAVGLYIVPVNRLWFKITGVILEIHNDGVSRKVATRPPSSGPLMDCG